MIQSAYSEDVCIWVLGHAGADDDTQKQMFSHFLGSFVTFSKLRDAHFTFSKLRDAHFLSTGYTEDE